MYGAQTNLLTILLLCMFENDVEMYGAQTIAQIYANNCCLRMM